VYLTKLRDKYQGLRDSIEGLQTRAAEENRDLTEEELRSIKEMGDQAKPIADQIKDLAEIETRNQKVGEVASTVFKGSNEGSGSGSGSGTSNTTAVDRNPGHYRRMSEGAQFSYFGDMYRAQMGDEEAAYRQYEHKRSAFNAHGEVKEEFRALTTSVGAGVIPPVWMGEEYEQALRQGRALANAVRRIPITSPAAMTLPRQTTKSAVAEQADENDEVNEADPGFGSDTVTLTPKARAGKQTVSRQLLEASDPSVDEVIFTDLIEDYSDKIEALVAAAVLAADESPLEADATETDVKDSSHYNKMALRAQVDVRKNRKNRRADFYTMSQSRWGDLLGLTDTSGRPLIPAESGGPRNVFGVGSVEMDGVWHGIGVIPTEAFEPEEVEDPLEDSFAAVYARDVLLFESGIQRFSFDQPAGPESIIVAVWAYGVVHVRYSGAGIRVVEVGTGS
jgi:HK97 family phage major capsid protein